ncbi:MAG: twin-arginine translocase subunit TatC [Vicinamibacteria bacterium]
MSKLGPPPAKMTFLEHLDELRRRIIISLLAVVIAFALCFTFAKQIFDFLMGPLRAALPPGGELIATAVPEIFLLYLKMSFFAGIFLASPIILSQVWLFVAPGLYRNEKRYAVPFIFLGTGFFLGGASFGHFVVFPYAAHFLTTFGGDSIDILLTVSLVFGFYSKFILGMGLVFEIPTLVFVLARMGLVTPGFLWAKFKYAVLLIFVTAAIITPTPDVVTQSLLAIPMIGLYILSIGIAWLCGREGESLEESSTDLTRPD